MKRSCWWGLFVVLVLLGMSQPVVAQSDDAGRFFIAGKVGGHSLFAEDGENGTTFGGGVAAGFFFTPRWGFEFEWWRPDYVETDYAKVRDTLYSFSLVYRWERERIQPYVLAGYSYARVDQPNWPAGNYHYFQAGFGVGFRLGDHFIIAPEFRANIGTSATILRPCVSLMVTF
jgi:hypothetical protein